MRGEWHSSPSKRSVISEAHTGNREKGRRSPYVLIAYSTDDVQRGRGLGGTDDAARQHRRREYAPASRGQRSRLASDWAVLSCNQLKGKRP